MRIFLNILCVSILFICSCQDDMLENQSSKQQIVNEITALDAEQILLNFIQNSDPAKLNTRGSSVSIKAVQKRYSVQKTRTSGVSTESVAFYNFDLESNSEKGFAIVCGDKRLPQVIAYSTRGSLEDIRNCGNVFLTNYVTNLPDAVTELLANRQGLAGLNNRYTAGFSYLDVPDVAHTWETDSTIERVVFLQESTTWEQDAPYNKLMPVNPNTKQPYLVGCSNIACVNIMAYYCYPETYNWAAMKQFRVIVEGYQPDTVVTEAAQLCKDIFTANNSTPTEDGTATNSDDVITGLQSFGYVSSPLMNYNLDSIKVSLEHFYPVYMRGQDPSETTGHAFVVRGYWEVKPKAGVNRDSTVSIGINWGWMGGFGDGFYLARYIDVDLTILGLYPLLFTSNGPEYSYLSYADKIKLITRIHPYWY